MILRIKFSIRWISFIFLISFSCSICAQVKWLNYAPDDLTPHLYQSDNYMWVAYRGGLASIDLSTEETFIYNAANCDLPDNYLGGINPIANDKFWLISGYVPGVFENGSFNYPDLEFPEELIFGINTPRVVDKNGNLLCQARTTDDNFNTEHYIIRLSENDPVEVIANTNGISHLTIDAYEKIWYASSSEVVVRDGNQQTTFNSSNSPVDEDLQMLGLHPYDNGIVLLQYDPEFLEDSLRMSIDFYDGNEWKPTQYLTTYSETPYVPRSFIDEFGDLRISNPYALFHYEDGTWESSEYPLEFGISEWGSRFLLHVDADDNFWYRVMDYDNNRLYRYKDGVVDNFIIANANMVSSLVQDIFIDSKNRTWFAGLSGVSKFESQEWTNYSEAIYDLGYYRQFHRSLGEDNNGIIYVGLSHDSEPFNTLMFYDGNDWESVNIQAPNSWNTTTVNAMFFDKNNVLWGATSDGLLRYDGMNPYYYTVDNSILEETYVDDIEPTSDSTFYFYGWDNDLNFYNGSDIEKIPVPLAEENDIYDLFWDSNQILWMVTRDDGLVYWDDGNYVIIQDEIDQFGDMSIFNITQDSKGVYWFATTIGLMRYDEENWEMLTEGYPGGWLTSVEVDSFDNVWMVSNQSGIGVYNENGIDHLSFGGNRFYEISGNFYWDINENGLKESDEVGLAQQRVQLLPDGLIKHSSIFGNYKFNVGPNQSVVVQPILENEWELSSDSSMFHVHASQNYEELDFGLINTDLTISGEVSVNPPFPRCFSTGNLWVSAKNSGFQVLNGSVRIEIDNDIEFIDAVPAPDEINGNFLTWQIEELNPFQFFIAELQVEYPNETSIGDVVVFKSELFDDSENLLDEELISQVVVCSYDPNDKTAFATGDSNGPYSLLMDPLEYLIRFENTGNDTAFTVVIQDTISTDLDISSLEVLAASHEYELQLRGNVVEFVFENIELLYTDLDSIASHGFVRYKIDPIDQLATGSIIENTALIFFDFNPPIITNTTENILVDELSADENLLPERRECLLSFYPNPTSDYIHLSKEVEIKNANISLFNSIGELVMYESILESDQRIDLTSLTSGIYLYNLRTEDKFCSGKIILE